MTTPDDGLIQEVLPVAPWRPRRHILEIFLEPRNIQWLLGLGGALMVAGLIILLWVNKYFTPPVIAATMGLGNASLLVGGWSMLRRTRYQVAGRALTLLACLVMPLNLWYYHAHALMTIDGHLWIAALVISALYAASAVVLRDELFVYVFTGGIALTGLLILADLPPSPQKFWEIASPSTLLVALGLLALHTERAFPAGAGPFTRKRFGLAFFWSGHALLAGGLVLVLGAQVASDWLYQPIFRIFYDQWHAGRTPIVTKTWGQILALCLVLSGTYPYLYSDVVVRRVGIYLYLAAGTLLWAEVLLLEILQLHVSMDVMMAVLAGTGLLVNLALTPATRKYQLTRAFPILGLFLGILPLALGLVVLAKAVGADFKTVWASAPPTWIYIGAIFLTAVSCRLGAHINRIAQPVLSWLLFFAAAAATMIGAVALLAVMDMTRWQNSAPLLALVPIAYLTASRLYRGRAEEKPLLCVSYAAICVVLLCNSLGILEGFTSIKEQQQLNLLLAWLFAEAALFCGLTVAWQRQVAALQVGAALACAAVWQLLTYAGVEGETYALLFAVVGLLLLLAHRWASLERSASATLANGIFQSANALLSLSIVAALFMGLSRLASRNVHWSFVAVCCTLALISLCAVAAVRNKDWRRWYVATTVLQGLLTFLAIQALSTLTVFQKFEIFGVAAGLALLVVGHVGWYREQEKPNDIVSASLLLGSLLAGVPLVVAVILDRWHTEFIFLDETGFLAVSVLLLVTGIIFELKSTTLTGAVLTALYFLLLLIFVPWSRLNTVALSITVGGGLLFTTGLLLSVYRDRLLSLPDRVKRHEGIFRIINWR
ncbi:MAG TPA: hypothetical protein VK395_25410 [Gemmataceae bacterium]|nr:hypothetical protein [Gemmataceae bacterium]